MVQDVDGFSAELQTLMFDDGEALGDADVDRLQAGSGKASDLAVAEARGGLGDGARVEPDVAGAAWNARGSLWSFDGLSVAVGPWEARRGSGVVGGLRGDGEAIVELQDGVDLPTTNDKILRAIHVRSEGAATTERQVVGHEAIEGVRHVLIASAIIGVR